MGGRSRAAAQLLSGKGFKEVYNLKGGLAAWNGQTAAGPYDMGMAPLKELQTPEQVIIFAYGLEKGLEEFYSAVKEMTGNPDVSGLLGKLAGVEAKHKERLFRQYVSFDQEVSDMEAFETGLVSEMMEGGFTTDTFLEKNREALETTEGVLNVAMMLEAQSLDLYMRYAHAMKEEKDQSIFHSLADEEKTHLGYLGDLLEEQTHAL
ncbi:MAG: sulfurtransferase [Desulfatiglans sp.]|nr:sulfurtransferase [Desulfatiglans sp.]